MTEENHAISNAKAWLAEIVTKTAALKAAEEACHLDAPGADEVADNLRIEIEESVLSLQVRGGWHNPGDREGIDAKPEEFEILLSTGGPALRIFGDLDEFGQVWQTPLLQWQDWGTPWTDYPTTGEEDEALVAFSSVFWFGD